MDDFSISSPMRAPILESTAVIADERQGGKHYVDSQNVLSCSSASQGQENINITDTDIKQQSGEVRHGSNKEVNISDFHEAAFDDQDDYSDSFFEHDNETESPKLVEATAPFILASSDLGRSYGIMDSMHADRQSSVVIGLSEAAVTHAVSLPFVNDCGKPALPLHDLQSLGTSSSLSPDATLKQSSHLSPSRESSDKNSPKYKQNSCELSMTGEQSSEKPAHMRCDGRDLLGEDATMDSTCSKCVYKSTASMCLTSKVAMDPSVKLGSVAKSPVIRSRLDPITNRFEEIVPAITTLSISDRHNSKLRHPRERVAPGKLSPWEDWLLKKTKEDLEKRRLIKQQKLEKEQHEAKMKEKKYQTREKAVIVHKEWVRQKTAEERAKQKIEEQRTALQEEALNQRRQLTQAKACASYEQWRKKKEQDEAQLRVEMKEQAKHRDLRHREIQEQSKHAYGVWLRTVGSKPIDRDLLFPETHRNFVYSSCNKHRLRRWNFY